MSRWQGRLEHKQAFLGRIVDIGAELFAMTAVVHARPTRTPDDLGPQAVELADTFCQQARLRVDALFDRLWDNSDTQDVRLARYVLDGRYTFLEEGILDPSIEGPWIGSPQGGENVRRKIPDERSRPARFSRPSVVKPRPTGIDRLLNRGLL